MASRMEIRTLESLRHAAGTQSTAAFPNVEERDSSPCFVSVACAKSLRHPLFAQDLYLFDRPDRHPDQRQGGSS